LARDAFAYIMETLDGRLGRLAPDVTRQRMFHPHRNSI
jgi:hypothetical protein